MAATPLITAPTITTTDPAGMTAMNEFDYISDPDEIYRRSFDTVRAEADLDSLPDDMAPVAERLVHACGMPDIIAELSFSAGAAGAGRQALAAGAPILVDVGMVGQGIIRPRLPAGNDVVCMIGSPEAAGMAREKGTTRSAAAVDLWRPQLEGAVIAIGNAPTALFRLLELLADGAPVPAFIAAFPVGFIGAAESKEALIAHAGTMPYLTLRGRRGGSAMAAACVNALAANGAGDNG